MSSRQAFERQVRLDAFNRNLLQGRREGGGGGKGGGLRGGCAPEGWFRGLGETGFGVEQDVSVWRRGFINTVEILNMEMGFATEARLGGKGGGLRTR